MAHYVELTWEGTLTARTRRERSACMYRSYIADPLLGRELALPADLVADMADAERAIVALQDRDTGLASVESVARLLLRAEAVGSSYIEGLQINARRLAKEALAAQTGIKTDDDTARAVLANIDAMQEALELADVNRPITVDDICKLHARLLAGTSDAHWGGIVRNEQNWIGGINPCRAAYVPPPHAYVPELFEDLCAYISGDDHSAIVQAAMAHAQFETIHPFVDGNGRVGRALIHLVLRRRGLATSFVPPVSLILATNAGAYIAGLVGYRYDAPSFDPVASPAAVQWIGRFTNELIRACDDATTFATALSDLEQQWRSQVGRIRANSAVDELLSALPGLPILNVETAATAIGRSRARTSEAVTKLLAVGVLSQGTIGRRNRVFEANGLLDAITTLERQLASPASDTAIANPTRVVPSRRVTTPG